MALSDPVRLVLGITGFVLAPCMAAVYPDVISTTWGTVLLIGSAIVGLVAARVFYDTASRMRVLSRRRARARERIPEARISR